MATTISRKNYKKIEIVFGVIIGIILLSFLGVYEMQKYVDWKFKHDLAEMQAAEDRPYLEDTYGGKTPQETLELFIAAVEKGDYDLASKYFILSKQEEWKNGLQKIKEKNNIDFVLEKLKLVDSEIRSSTLGSNLNSQSTVTFGSKTPVTFVKYPQGNWKIQEI